jgi:hypothetical protein
MKNCWRQAAFTPNCIKASFPKRAGYSVKINSLTTEWAREFGLV